MLFNMKSGEKKTNIILITVFLIINSFALSIGTKKLIPEQEDKILEKAKIEEILSATNLLHDIARIIEEYARTNPAEVAQEILEMIVKLVSKYPESDIFYKFQSLTLEKIQVLIEQILKLSSGDKIYLLKIFFNQLLATNLFNQEQIIFEKKLRDKYVDIDKIKNEYKQIDKKINDLVNEASNDVKTILTNTDNLFSLTFRSNIILMPGMFFMIPSNIIFKIYEYIYSFIKPEKLNAAGLINPEEFRKELKYIPF